VYKGTNDIGKQVAFKRPMVKPTGMARTSS
jgi:hypothetical protein